MVYTITRQIKVTPSACPKRIKNNWDSAPKNERKWVPLVWGIFAPNYTQKAIATAELTRIIQSLYYSPASRCQRKCR